MQTRLRGIFYIESMIDVSSIHIILISIPARHDDYSLIWPLDSPCSTKLISVTLSPHMPSIAAQASSSSPP